MDCACPLGGTSTPTSLRRACAMKVSWRDGRVRTALVGIAVSTACVTLIVAIAMVMRSRANDAAAKYDIEGGIYLAVIGWILATAALTARIVLIRNPGRRADVAFSTPRFVDSRSSRGRGR